MTSPGILLTQPPAFARLSLLKGSPAGHVRSLRRALLPRRILTVNSLFPEDYSTLSDGGAINLLFKARAAANIFSILAFTLAA